MKTIVCNSLSLYRPRLAALLSVMQEAIDTGDSVVFIGCDGFLPACTSNPDRIDAICRYCTARRNKGLRLVSGRFATRELRSYLNPGEFEQVAHSIDDLRDVASVKGLEYEGVDVGYAALSSYVSVTREPAPELGDPSVRKTLQMLVNTGKLVHTAFRRALGEEAPDRVFMFNGRLATDRAVLRACQQAGVDCHVFEVPLRADRVSVYKNTLPQDVGYVTRTIEKLWEEAPGNKVEVARTFFEMRRKAQPRGEVGKTTIFTNDRNFARGQEEGKLPEEWSEHERNVVIFSSSEDEYAAIGKEYDDNLYPSPLEGVRRICEGLAGDVGTRVYLRLHPHLNGIKNSFVRDLKQLGMETVNLVVVPAESSVSSYAMMDRADSVVVFRSTIGLEAVYWGKPCILLSNSFYRQLDATYNPESHEEVIRLIRADLSPKDKTPALMAGYERLTLGFEQIYFGGDKRRGHRRAFTFKGDPIRVGGWLRWRYKRAARRAQAKA